MAKRKALIQIGQVFEYLEVLEEVGKDKYRNYLYRCRCNNCGNEKIVKGSSLISQNTRSCGCLMRTRAYIKTGVQNGSILNTQIN